MISRQIFVQLWFSFKAKRGKIYIKMSRNSLKMRAQNIMLTIFRLHSIGKHFPKNNKNIHGLLSSTWDVNTHCTHKNYWNYVKKLLCVYFFTTFHERVSMECILRRRLRIHKIFLCVRRLMIEKEYFGL